MTNDEQPTDDWLTDLETAKVDARDATDLRAIGTALLGIDAADSALVDAIAQARRNGRSWTEIANVLGVSRQAARQRFQDAVTAKRVVNPGDTMVIGPDVWIIGATRALRESAILREDVSDDEIAHFLQQLTPTES